LSVLGDQAPEGGNLFPVSVKGVLLDEGCVVLLQNERREWELPGGKLEIGESPEECVVREIREEPGLEVEVGPLIEAFVYEVLPGASVLILTYGCFAEDPRGLSHSEEHSDVGIFGLDDLEGIVLPRGYERSIRTWSRHPVLLEWYDR
jgi:8-oxo-dGTP pyrophosphatase MutT (NUDIX family)